MPAYKETLFYCPAREKKLYTSRSSPRSNNNINNDSDIGLRREAKPSTSGSIMFGML